ncbi:MAG TPA: helix-turn-helix domain-containing protein [Candidatus Diapherotrites archaeon]|uniref:DNA helicase n=1 Tax=Candidatus Iainarchaeum sp. TaxID=3101447 RepID=A0A7J4IXD1_9ARCH|nr:helix-turn-helix domain-containing protein [Candidatus Diapherotrites archaeon]
MAENSPGQREDNPFVEKFREFLEERYKKEIERLSNEYPAKRSIFVDFRELEHYDTELADELLANSDTCIDAAHQAIKEIEIPLLDIGQEGFAPHIRIFNLPIDRQPKLKDISASHIGKIISVEGVVRQVTDVLPKLKFASWKCTRCEANYKVPQTKSIPKMPTFCSECKNRVFVLEEESSEFEDYQKIQVQEPLELLKGSEQATNLDIYVSDDLVNRISPGDRTRITGIVRLMPPKEKKVVYGRYLEALHLEETAREFEEVEINPDEEEEIKKLAARDDIYDLLIQSIAPHIYGHEVMKESIALQLFGGVKKNLPNDQHVRGNIHVLLVGDPGMAKCVSGDTRMLMSDGTLCRMDEFAAKHLDENTATKLDDGFYSDADATIPVMDGNGKIRDGKVIRVFKRKPTEMFEIMTWSGRKVKVTHTHPLFVCSEGKIKAIKAMNLATTDFVAVPRKLQLKGRMQKLEMPCTGKTNAAHITVPQYLNAEVARFMGYFCAEGYSEKTRSTIGLRFTNSDKEALDDFTRISVREFGITPHSRNGNNCTEVRVSGVELGGLLKKNAPGILERPAGRHIPQKILSSTLEVKREFLRGYYEGEGHVRRDIRMVELCTASPLLAQQLRQMLLEFGIVSTCKEVDNCATNGSRAYRKYYRTRIGGKFAIRFAKEIGFITERKKAALAKCTLNGKNINTNNDIVPNIGKELKKARELLGLSQFKMGIARTTYQHFERGDRNPSREALQKIAITLIGELELSNSYDKELQEKVLNIHKHAFSEIFWDRIKKAEKIENEEWIYDVEVEQFHNFISNGVISHNSQILKATDAIAPKSIYVAGKTSTGAGLSATAVKDEFGEGGWTLKAGALVLASGGMAMVDEFDKMEKDDRSAMHEAMEQQQISVAKAGIVTKFKCDTSILAAANPKYSRFDPYQPFIEQIDLPASLISRFDLFFMIKDVLDRKKDLEIAGHILKSHKAGEMMLQRMKQGISKKDEELEEITELITPKISGEILKKYISYARQNIFPVLENDSMQEISDFYIALRDQGRKEGAYSATHRQLEGMIRLSEASARVRLSNKVERRDVERAIRLIRTSLEDMVTDPETGKIDIDIITSGQTHTMLSNLKKILGIIREKAQEFDIVPMEEVISEAKTMGIDAEKVRELIAKLQKSGDIYYPKHGFVKPA